MIDIHCHILEGIDDGAEDMDESIAMAKIAFNDGIQHIIATPHFTENHINDKAIVDHKVTELQKRLKNEQIPITIHCGNEVRIESAAFIYEHMQKKTFHYLGKDNKFILLEQSWKAYNENSPEIVQGFLDQGVTPIIPHPERHVFFRKRPKLLLDLIQMGCWTQISVDSLLGKNSDDAKEFAEWLMENDLIHTIATDAHNTNRRPNLSEGFRIVNVFAGTKRAEEIHLRLQQIVKC